MRLMIVVKPGSGRLVSVVIMQPVLGSGTSLVTMLVVEGSVLVGKLVR